MAQRNFQMTRFARHLGVGGAVHGAARELPPTVPLWRKIVDPIATFLATLIALLFLASLLVPG
jgi:hypothetical protein